MAITVLPAIGGALGPDIIPASSAGVMPQEIATGGQSNDCTLLGYPGPAYSSFRIDSPKSQSYPITVGNKTVTFTLSISTGSNKDKLFDYIVQNAVVYAIGVKGGTKTAGYIYRAAPAGEAKWPAVAKPADTALYSDANLHGPRDNQNKLYSISNVTFCFDARTATIGGRVFEDKNANSTPDTGEGGLQQPVTLTRGATSVSVPVAADGTFSIANQPVGLDYTLCVAGSSTLRLTVPTSGFCYPITLTAAGSDTNLFGFIRQATIDGTLFNDANANGTPDTGEGAVDPVRKVYLIRGTQVVELPNIDGSFSFGYQDVGATYTVCVEGVTGEPQTYPVSATIGSGVCSSVTGANPVGWQFQLAADVPTNLGFGSVDAVTPACGTSFGNLPDYRILLDDEAPCEKSFLVDFSDPNRTATLQPVGGGGLVPMVEYIRWTLPTDGTQVQLQYDDTLPYNDLKEMLHCKLDPRVDTALEAPAPNDDDLKLAATLPADSAVFPAAPAGYDARNGLVTSCIILDKEKDGKYVTYVYSAVDGQRQGI